MNNTNLISYKEYIIDTEQQTYKAIWNCQVEWTAECIYYDAETGRVELGDDELEFVCEHQHKVTKHEYQDHVKLASQITALTHDQLKEHFNYRQVV
jgi:hypothetical protein